MNERIECQKLWIRRLGWISLGGMLALWGCAGEGESGGSEGDSFTVEFEDVELGSAEQAYSDAECKAALADATGNMSLATGFFGQSPQTYSNPAAFKSYIWDITSKSFALNVYPYANVDATRINPMDYDTQAECTAISFNRRLYKRIASGSFTLYAQGFAHATWDADYGCALPRYWGPFLEPPNTITEGSVIRACMSARRADGNTLPVTLAVSPTKGFSDDVFQGPVVKIGANFLPVGADNTSGNEYCKRRGDLRMGALPTLGACVTSYAFYSTALRQWRAGVVAPGLCANVWARLNCEIPVSPAL